MKAYEPASSQSSSGSSGGLEPNGYSGYLEAVTTAGDDGRSVTFR
jgi:hypothetical protein